MNDVDAELRALLTERAAEIPAPVGLFAAVHRRERRARQRRLVMVSVAGVLLLLAGVALAWTSQRDDRLVPTNEPPARGLTAPAAPVTVTRVPAGFTPPQASLVARGTWSIKSIRRTPLAQLTVRVATTALTARTGVGTRRTIMINGAKATYYTVPFDLKGARPTGQTPPPAQRPMAQLTYQRKPGQWIQIDVHNTSGNPALGVTEQDLRKIATGLVDRPMRVPEVLRFASLPSGVTYGSVWNPGQGIGGLVQFVYPAAPPEPTDLGGSYSVDFSRVLLVVQAGPSRYPGFRRPLRGEHARVIRVDGRAVTVIAPEVRGQEVVLAPFGKGGSVMVTAAPALGLSIQQLARFALSVRPGKDYTCCMHFR